MCVSQCEQHGHQQRHGCFRCKSVLVLLVVPFKRQPLRTGRLSNGEAERPVFPSRRGAALTIYKQIKRRGSSDQRRRHDQNCGQHRTGRFRLEPRRDHEALQYGRGHGAVDAVGVGDLERVDADRRTVGIHERPAGVAGIDRGVDLQHTDVRPVFRKLHFTHGADKAVRDGDIAA